MELEIVRNYLNRTVDFYANTGGRDITFLHIVDGNIEHQQSDPASADNNIKPLFSLPMRYADDFIKEVALYASGKGIQTENENHLKGKLQATEKHLDSTQANFDKLLAAYINGAPH